MHRVGEDVTIYTRSLDDITERLPGVSPPYARWARSAWSSTARAAGRGRAAATLPGDASAVGRTGALADDLRVSWFDLLHLDGVDLVDRPLTERLAALDGLVPADQVVERLASRTGRGRAGRGGAGFFDATLAAATKESSSRTPTAPYAAGRRGAPG